MSARNIGDILERQAKAWQLRRRMAEEGGEKARKSLSHLPEGPWLTISRPLGSGGAELAERLAAELGWQAFDHEILAQIAQETDAREVVLADLHDERAMGGISDYLTSLLLPGNPGQVPYLKEMGHVIVGLARKGHAIILGRGANWVLGEGYGLRLRVVAPDEVRQRRISEVEGIGLDEAAKRIKDNDQQQVAFIKQAYGKSLDDPLGYDMVLNLGSLDLETATQTVLAALRRKLDR